MYEFDFHRPHTLEDVERLLESDDQARLLAGGMSLLPAMKMHLSQPGALIDLSGVAGMTGVTQEQGLIRIGAMTLHVDVALSPLVQEAIPALAALAGGIGDRQVRNRGTIGGSLANNDPAACYPSAVLGLGATVVTNRRRIDSDSFFLGLFETALEPTEFIVAVEFPRPTLSGYEKFHQRASRFALVGVFVSVSLAGDVRVAVTGAGPGVFRVPALEAALAAEFTSQAAEAVEVDAEGLNSDMHGDAEYRAALIPVIAGRAVEHATRKTQG